MEKYGQYRDKGSGIAPFFPIPPQASNPLFLPWNFFLFCLRLPLVSFAWVVWLSIIKWTTPGNILRKANLWCVLGIPGVWWIDLQVDGVRRGSLSQTPRGRLPMPGTIIASSYTSPLDILYLAAIFDPIFTIGQPDLRNVWPVSLEGALAACFNIQPPPPFKNSASSVPLSDLVKKNRSRVIVVFPEATTSNGRGILKLAPSLLSASKDTKVFPVSLRYTPPDIVVPIPGWWEAIKFIWRLNSRPTHCIRVRIGAPVTLLSAPAASDSPETRSKTSSPASSRDGYEKNIFDTLESSPKINGEREDEDEDEDDLSEQDKKALDAVADTLARLGRVKRVGLGVEEKRKFVEAWSRRGKYRT